MPDKPLSEHAVREKLSEVVGWGEAHADWNSALTGVEESKRGVRPPGLPHSLWELLEHVRIAQWDIIEFTKDAKHKSPEWPSGYWPKSPAPPDAAAWDKSVKEFFKGVKELQAIALDPKVHLDQKIPHGTGQTPLRQILLLADHNAYHLGQFVLVRRALDDWKGN
jgi:DinB superfamily